MKEKYIIGNNNYEVIILKTIWKGAINFGLVNIPVKLKTATSRQNIRFRNLHEECNNPVKMKRFCANCQQEVDYSDLVKGYEYEENKYVILNDEDFDKIPESTTRTIDIMDFVKLEEIDPVYYNKTYYLEPAEGGEKPYLLLKKSLDSTDKIAISRITIRNRESLAVVRVLDGILSMETMYFAEEVRSTEGLNLVNLDQVDINEKEEELAVEIINNLSREFEPEKYENRYKQELMTIIQRKIEGEEIETAEAERTDETVVDLMEKLKATIETTEENEEEEELNELVR